MSKSVLVLVNNCSASSLDAALAVAAAVRSQMFSINDGSLLVTHIRAASGTPSTQRWTSSRRKNVRQPGADTMDKQQAGPAAGPATAAAASTAVGTYASQAAGTD